MSTWRPRLRTQFSKRWLGAMCLASAGILVGILPGPAVAQTGKAPPDTFLQGPEKVDTTVALSGKVIGIRNELERRCYIILVDKPEWPQGMGGGGRALLCSSTTELQMGQTWKGRVRQTGTGRMRMGPRWRVVPLFDIP